MRRKKNVQYCIFLAIFITLTSLFVYVKILNLDEIYFMKSNYEKIEHSGYTVRVDCFQGKIPGGSDGNDVLYLIDIRKPLLEKKIIYDHYDREISKVGLIECQYFSYSENPELFDQIFNYCNLSKKTKIDSNAIVIYQFKSIP